MRENRVIKLPVFRTLFNPIAQKAWVCDLCKKPVVKGRRYVHYIDRGIHEIIHYRFHNACFKVVMRYCKENGRKTFTPTLVRNWAGKKLKKST